MMETNQPTLWIFNLILYPSLSLSLSIINYNWETNDLYITGALRTRRFIYLGKK